MPQVPLHDCEKVCPVMENSSCLSSTEAQVATHPIPGRLWKVEIEDRDDPVPVTATFDLNAQRLASTFTTAQGRIQTEQNTLTGDTLTFHIPDNSLFATAEGTVRFARDTLTGVLKTADSLLTLHGRRMKTETKGEAMPPTLEDQGPGFRDLILEGMGVRETLLERMRFYHVPAVSLARMEDYEVVEVGAFGVTDVKTRVPVDANTLFQAGGMGSPLVGLLALRLAAQGRLDLNRPVNSYLKSAQIADNVFTRTRKITVLDLMRGASGLSQTKFRGYRLGQAVHSLSELLNGADPNELEPLQPLRTPGTIGHEGVCGAVLEQTIVDAVGKPFPQLMQKEIFTPCGMAHSAYLSTPRSTVHRKIALGHYGTGELTLDRFHIYPEQGETGLWTTAGDFARILCQVQRLLVNKPNRLLTQEQRDRFQSLLTEHGILRFVAADKGDILPPGYLYHGGASYGYYANHATHRENGTGAVVMENRNLGWALNNEIILAVRKRSLVITDGPRGP